MQETKLAWLAGIVDGEGCLHAQHVHQNNQNSIVVRLEVQVVSTVMIDAICSILDELSIKYGRSKPYYQPLSKRPCIRLRVETKRDLLRLLLVIQPFLVVKLTEANECISFLSKACSVSRYVLQDGDLSFVTRLKNLKLIA